MLFFPKEHLVLFSRSELWKSGKDFAHGTGHGVGYCLNVHEGPFSISKNNNIPLQEGMVFSNEPGYYLEGKFGIRIENLVTIKKKTIRGNNKPFMNKELSKAIKNKSRMRNKYNKWKSRENYLEYQKSKKLCKFIAFKAEKLHFEQTYNFEER